ncbi:MAG: histidine kinase [Lacibacter sp.]
MPDSIEAQLQLLPEGQQAKWLYEKGAELTAAEPQRALPLLRAARQWVVLQKDSALLPRVLNELSACYMQLEAYTEALPLLLEAEKILLRNRADSLLIDTYTSLGIVYERTEKYEQAINYYNKVRGLLVAGNASALEQARNLTNIGHAQEGLQQFDAAEASYRQALQLCEQNNIAFGIALLNQNLASVKLQQKAWAESRSFSATSLGVAQQQNFPRIVAAGYENTGAAWLGEKKYREAIPWLQQALARAIEISYHKTVMASANMLHECYDAVGNKDSALYFYKAYTLLKDSLFTSQKNKQLTELQTVYETEQKETAIGNLQQQNELARLNSERKNLIIASLVAIFLLAALGVWFYLRQNEERKRREQLEQELRTAEEKQKLEQMRNESELSALKAQMNPHFIFNALNSIQEMILLGDKKMATEHLGRFSDLTRAILDSSGKKKIVLHDEIQILNDYLSLEQLRFEKDFSFSIEVAPQVDPYAIQLPPMLIQPYVENAIKHGLMHKEGKKELKIKIELPKPDLLQVVVEDNGIGRQKAAYFASMRPKKHRSFSSGATERRLSLLNAGNERNIGVAYEDLLVNEQPAGTRVTISIPTETVSAC